jgi:MtrB/PioB family decaheme-associated outer membrane protein
MRLAPILVSGIVLLSSLAAESKEAKKQEGTETEAVEEKEDSGYHGEVNVGWRSFIQRPPYQDRAKFEEYGAVKPGPVLENFSLSAASKTSDAVFEAYGSNAGYNNQFYFVELYSPGKQYLKLTWDQIPHLYSTSARTLFDASMPNVLTIPSSIKQQLQNATSGFPNDTATVNSVLNNNLRHVSVGLQRDIGKVSYRWTPDPEWDFRVDYHNERKSGTKPLSAAAVYFNATEMLEPVNYRTQNFSASGQYTARVATDKKWSINFSYAGSIFENAYKSLTWDNPFIDTPPFSSPTYAPTAISRNSLPPDNYANRYSLNTNLDLPFNSRFAGTASYSQMRQNDQFIPMTINSVLTPSPLPASSLNGAIDTFLLNGVLTTKLSDQLTGTVRYRHYDNDNKTPILTFQDFVQLDSQVISAIRRNLAPQYKKDNASLELVWKPVKNLTVGLTPAWEKYDRDRRDVDVTNEFSGKIFVDTAPTEWLNVRASYLQGMRRFEHYDFATFVGIPGDPNEAYLYENIYMRKFDLANRDRRKAELFAELRPAEKIVVTPSLGWRDDRYGDTQAFGGDLGLKRDISWNAGAEVAYSFSRFTTFSIGYIFEHLRREMIDNSAGASAGVFEPATASNWGSKIADNIHTVTASANINVIPKQWDLSFRYTASLASSRTDTYALGVNNQTSNPQFPTVTNRYHRAEASSRYVLEPELVKKLGWTADEVSLRLLYVLEQNAISDWHWNEMLPYMVSSDPNANRSLFLAAINPNYRAQAVLTSIGFKW